MGVSNQLGKRLPRWVGYQAIPFMPYALPHSAWRNAMQHVLCSALRSTCRYRLCFEEHTQEAAHKASCPPALPASMTCVSSLVLLNWPECWYMGQIVGVGCYWRMSRGSTRGSNHPSFRRAARQLHPHLLCSILPVRTACQFLRGCLGCGGGISDESNDHLTANRTP